MILIIAISQLLEGSKGENSSNVCLAITYVEFQCFHSVGCERNAVQLVGGQNKFEGRVEVCQDGEWKTVCNDGWGDKEARVVCRQLGFAEDTRSELLLKYSDSYMYTDNPCIVGYDNEQS